MSRRAALAALLLIAGATAAAREDATGTWGGARTWLDEHGVHLDLDYTGEGFAGGGELAYRGNIDLVLILRLWPGGQVFLYGQNGHGDGISPAIGATLPVSNLEADDFTQLSEAWVEQRLLGDRLRLKLGKQDANREFGNPRFTGNFVNSSFGVLPTVPMPSFPDPRLGAMLAVRPLAFLEARGAVFDDIGGDGLLGIASLVVAHGGEGAPRGLHSAGAWIDGDARGLFGVLDVLFPLGGGQSIQTFVRAALARGGAAYAGGGVTYHGFFGRDDTIGLGAGHSVGETFLELFYKMRPDGWISFEPDAQLYLFDDGRTAFTAGLRAKVKL